MKLLGALSSLLHGHTSSCWPTITDTFPISPCCSYLFNNDLTGTLPAEWSAMSSLEQL